MLGGDIWSISTVQTLNNQRVKFIDEEHKAYPYVHFLWNRSHQLILLEVDIYISRSYESLIKQIGKHLNNLLNEYGYIVYIEPLTGKDVFGRLLVVLSSCMI